MASAAVIRLTVDYGAAVRHNYPLACDKKSPLWHGVGFHCVHPAGTVTDIFFDDEFGSRRHIVCPEARDSTHI